MPCHSDRVRRNYEEKVFPVSITAELGTVLRVYWKRPNGEILIQDYTCPPNATVNARLHEKW